MPKYVHKAKLSYAHILQNPPKKSNFMSPRPKSAIGIEGDANHIVCCKKKKTRIVCSFACVIHGMHWWFSYCIIMCMCVFICICIFAQFFLDWVQRVSGCFRLAMSWPVLRCVCRIALLYDEGKFIAKDEGKVTDTRWAGAATICMYWGFRIELLRYAHHRYRKQNTFAMFVCVRVWIHCIRCCINICNHSVFLHNDMWMWIVQSVFLYLRTCAHVLYVSTYVYIYVDLYFSMYLCLYMYMSNIYNIIYICKDICYIHVCICTSINVIGNCRHGCKHTYLHA